MVYAACRPKLFSAAQGPVQNLLSMGGESEQEKVIPSVEDEAKLSEEQKQGIREAALELEGESEPVDPRMAAVLQAAESGDLETLCSLFDQVEVSRCTLPSRFTVPRPCFTK